MIDKFAPPTFSVNPVIPLDRGGLTQKDKDAIAWTILGEVGNGSAEDMASVAWVIRNRAESGRFPSNAAAVALQHNSKGVYQFSTWNSSSQSGNHPMQIWAKGSAAFAKALRTVEKTLAAPLNEDPTRGATNYYANTGANAISKPKWFDHEAPEGTVQIGSHVFGAKIPAGAYDNATAAPEPLTPESMADTRLRQDYEQLLGVSNGAALPYLATAGAFSGGWINDPAVGAVHSPDRLPKDAQLEARFEATNTVLTEHMQSMLVPQINQALVTRTVKSVRIDPLTGQPISDADEATTRLIEAKTQMHAAQAPSAATRTIRAIEVTTRGNDRIGQSIDQSHPTSGEQPGTLAMRGGARSGTGYGGSADLTPPGSVIASGTPKSGNPINGMSSLVGNVSGSIKTTAQAGNEPLPLGVRPNIPKLPSTATQTLQDIHDKNDTAYQPKFVTVTKQVPVKVVQTVPMKTASASGANETLQDIHDRRESGQIAAQISAPKPATPETRIVTVYRPQTTQVLNPAYKAPAAATPAPTPIKTAPAYDPRVDVTGRNPKDGGWGINAGGGIVAF